MSCSSVDLKAYQLGELAQREKASVEEHVRACEGCREDLDRLRLTQTALMSLEDEEIPQRIAFVSDKVFEPRWWQTIWRSGPAMGFASAVLLAAAILVHGFARPVPAPVVASAVSPQQIEQVVNAAVTKAVAESEARQSREFSVQVAAVQKQADAQRQSDLAVVQQAVSYYEKQMGRMMMASNDLRVGQ